MNDPYGGEPFVGRTPELEELGASLGEAARGRGRICLLAGDPGIGKTRLALRAGAVASDQGFSVLVGRCLDGGAAPAFWPWIQILRTALREGPGARAVSLLGEAAADLTPLVPEMRLRDAAASGASSDPEAERFRLFDTVTGFFRSACHAAPLLLLLDDLQWADLPSLLLLRFLGRAVSDLPIAVLGAYRDSEVDAQHPLTEAISELRREPGFRTIGLRGLAEEDVFRLGDAIVGEELPRDLARVIAGETGGNPLFVCEIVRQLVGDRVLYRHDGQLLSRVAPQEMRVPESVCTVIRSRLDRLAKTSRRLLAVAAMIGAEIDRALLADVAAAAPREVEAALREAGNARIVSFAGTRCEFAHDLVRQTLSEELTSPERQMLRRRLVRALETRVQGGDERWRRLLVHHALESAETAEATEAALQHAVFAAESALKNLAYEEAVTLYESVLRILTTRPHDGRRSNLLCALGDALFRSGGHERSREVYREAADLSRKLRDPRCFARAALGVADPYAQYGVFDPVAAGLLEEALQQPAVEPALRARLLARLGEEYEASNLFADRGAPLLREAVGVARESADARALSYALTSAWRLRRMSVEERRTLIAEMVRVADEARDPELLAEAHLRRLIDLLDQGDAAGIAAAMDAYERLAKDLRLPRLLAQAEVHRAMWALLQGRHADAERSAARALSLNKTFQRDAAQTYGVQTFLLRREQGRLEELEPLARGMVQQYPGIPGWRAALAIIYAETGRLKQAAAELELLATRSFADVPVDRSWTATLSNLGEVAAAVGDGERAAVLYDLLLPIAETDIVVGTANVWLGPAARVLGLLAAALGRIDEAENRFETAASRCARLGARPWLARTRHDHAGALLRRGAPGDGAKALALLDAAIVAAREISMNALLEKALAARARAEEMLAAPPGVEGLRSPVREELFRRDGDYWTISYRGQTARVRDMKGLKHLAALLVEPGREIPALVLASDGQENGQGERRSATLGDSGEILDRQAREEYAARIEELESDLQEARSFNDLGRIERTGRELEFLRQQLGAATVSAAAHVVQALRRNGHDSA